MPAGPALAQFYKDKTLTLLVNYGVGGNADTEARVYQQYLAKYIPGHPTIIIRNLPGAGGVSAMNQLGLNIGSQPDGLTVGYFTMSATVLITDDPVLKIKMDDLIPIAAARGWNVVYARKDIVPGGYTKPADFARARSVYAGGYQPRLVTGHAAAAGARSDEPALQDGDRVCLDRAAQQGNGAE